MLGSSHMIPARAAPCPNVADYVPRNAIAFSKNVKQPATSGGFPDGPNIVLSEFRVAIRGAPLRDMGAVAHRILHVLLSRCPAQIRHFWVRSIAIPMRNLMVRRRRGANEGLTDQAVHPKKFGAVNGIEPNHPVTMPLTKVGVQMSPRRAATGRFDPSNPTVVGNLVFGCARATFPSFSHNQRLPQADGKSNEIAAIATTWQEALQAGGWS